MFKLRLYIENTITSSLFALILNLVMIFESILIKTFTRFEEHNLTIVNEALFEEDYYSLLQS